MKKKWMENFVYAILGIATGVLLAKIDIDVIINWIKNMCE